MARTTIVPKAYTNPYLAPTANSLDFAFTAADVSNGNQIALTGKELILFHNAGAGAQTVTIQSVPDQYTREGDITAYSIGVDEFARWGPVPMHGWKQDDGYLYLDASTVDIEIAVIKIG